MSATNLSFSREVLLPVSPMEAFAWHEKPGAFARLTPPWEKVSLVSHQGGVRNGARVEVRVGLAGPLSVKAVYRHENYQEGALFCDVQEQGPFAYWRHEHRFLPGNQGEDSCLLVDAIEYRLPVGGKWVEPCVRKRLNRLFDYRHEVTLADLAHNARSGPVRPRQVLVSGASGLIGSALVHRLSTRGHAVRTLGRGKENNVVWDPDRGVIDTETLEGVDAVIHLAGAPVARRWTPSQKKRILDSRREGTRLLVESLGSLRTPPTIFLSASGINFYGHQLSTPADESSPSGEGFLAGVCREWEAAALKAQDFGARVCLIRTGIVLSPAGGALALMLKPFQAAMGGPLGTGGQIMSWIGLEDLLDVYVRALEGDSLSGPINAVAPGRVSNREFSATLGRVLRRPALLPVPTGVVHLTMGDMGREMPLADLPVRPAVLEKQGFVFRHADLEDCLRFTLGKRRPPPAEIH